MHKPEWLPHTSVCENFFHHCALGFSHTLWWISSACCTSHILSLLHFICAQETDVRTAVRAPLHLGFRLPSAKREARAGDGGGRMAKPRFTLLLLPAGLLGWFSTKATVWSPKPCLFKWRGDDTPEATSLEWLHCPLLCSLKLCPPLCKQPLYHTFQLLCLSESSVSCQDSHTQEF